MQASSLFYSATHSLQKIAMATSKVNENCHHVQNDHHSCEVKGEKFHFDVLRCYGVIKESFLGAESAPPGEVGLNYPTNTG